MPIKVTCPECHATFLVGDEFAGRPGRCPECTAVIIVAGPNLQAPEIHLDPSPYQAARGVEAYEDFPDRARRRREEDEQRSDYERDDYDDRAVEFKVDLEARAKAWSRVYKGLGYIQIAVILYFFNQVLQSVFFVVHGGMDPKDPNALPDSGELAIGLGVAFIMLFACVFWILGRLSLIRTPYLPARGWAKGSFFMVLASIASLFGLCCLFMMALGALANGPNPGAAAFLMFAVLMALLAMLLVAGGELCGMMALAKICDGLRAPSAANWARMSMVLMFVLIGVLLVGACGIGIYGAEQQRKKQAQNANIQNPDQNPPPIVKGGPAPKGKKGDVKKDPPVVPKDPPGGPNVQPPQPQQPNPFEDDGLDESTRIIFQACMVGLILLYLIQYSIALQKGRRAIRAEIRHLTGVPEDGYEQHRDEHYSSSGL
ncbi:MAG: hypothetical protein EXS09_16560 [Gemmataceae bacterium]|nr:hypothetical protein [Gemmataceae bacterium]